ncbi:hypothetical protein PFISCL1PPCAC_16437, partial [Pristionchus fissidentatus]
VPRRLMIGHGLIVLFSLPILVHSSPKSLNFCSPIGYRIIGGRSASVSKWPSQALFFNYGADGYGTMCGATVLNERWLLTAAHCVTNSTDKSYVNVGVKSLQKAKKTLKISRIFAHPGFNFNTVQNDIALLQVSKSIPMGPDVAPVCLSKDDLKLINSVSSGIVTGFGVALNPISPSLYIEEPSDILLETEVAIQNTAKCSSKWRSLSGGVVKVNTQKQMCAGSYFHGTGAGDSGGPLHVQDCAGNFVQVGITSFGANSPEGLIDQATYPGVYTRVSAFIPWIQSIIGYEEVRMGNGELNSSNTFSINFIVFLIVFHFV